MDVAPANVVGIARLTLAARVFFSIEGVSVALAQLGAELPIGQVWKVRDLADNAMVCLGRLYVGWVQCSEACIDSTSLI